MINEIYCYLSASIIKSKQGKNEYQFLISFSKPEIAFETYKERWQIETMFKALKSSGFNIEHTHLKDYNRILKLIHLVSIAFLWCYLVGDFLHEKVKSIKIKNHGRKAKSIFKYGLEYIANALINKLFENIFNIANFLSCT